MRKQGGTDPMIRLEIKKSIKSRYFLIAVALLYIMFMLGDSGQVLGDETSTTILQAIWNKFHGNWTKGFSSSYLTPMNNMWQDNAYLPVVMPVICGFPSVINYLEEISTKNKRMITIASTGKTGGGIVDTCDVALVIPSDSTARIQEMHILCAHIICQLIDDLDWGK